MNIREATKEDFDQIGPIFHEIAAAGETYAYPRDITKEQAFKFDVFAFQIQGRKMLCTLA